MREILNPRTEFWESSKTLKVLAQESYFRQEGSEEIQWPQTIKGMLSDSKAVVLVQQ